RIALFTGNYNHVEDGVSRTLGRLVGYLIDEGHEVLVVGPSISTPLDQPGDFLEVPSTAIPGRPEYRISTRFPASVRQKVLAFRPDIVHIATPDVLGHRALSWGRGLGLPVVTTYHTHFASYLDFYRVGFAEPLLWAAFRRFYNRCLEVYAPTPAMRDTLLEHGITSEVRLWPRGIEADRFHPSSRSDEWRKSRGFDLEDVVVTFVSRLVKEKGIDVYADTIRTLQAEEAPVRALVVGDGPERSALEDALPDAVFTGHLGGTEIATAYASSDVFLFPSETETFGNVTLEAMASGLAVVVADAAGSASLVEDGRTGSLCSPRDRNAFADATRAFIEDANRRERFGIAAREAALTYNWPDVLDRMVGYYRAVLEDG
ncbi:glycosyltransferase family 4 protein, partial [Rubrivirga sp.]|uniref:glycosyltransferase family 4 protein n=1 Tax=Rubrivirga sp. TaxID=1885344 RepID=UPI003C774FEA